MFRNFIGGHGNSNSIPINAAAPRGPPVHVLLSRPNIQKVTRQLMVASEMKKKSSPLKTAPDDGIMKKMYIGAV